MANPTSMQPSEWRQPTCPKTGRVLGLMCMASLAPSSSAGPQPAGGFQGPMLSQSITKLCRRTRATGCKLCLYMFVYFIIFYYTHFILFYYILIYFIILYFCICIFFYIFLYFCYFLFFMFFFLFVPPILRQIVPLGLPGGKRLFSTSFAPTTSWSSRQCIPRGSSGRLGVVIGWRQRPSEI